MISLQGSLGLILTWHNPHFEMQSLPIDLRVNPTSSAVVPVESPSLPPLDSSARKSSKISIGCFRKSACLEGQTTPRNAIDHWKTVVAASRFEQEFEGSLEDVSIILVRKKQKMVVSDSKEEEDEVLQTLY